jgi:hypothetical protein
MKQIFLKIYQKKLFFSDSVVDDEKVSIFGEFFFAAEFRTVRGIGGLIMEVTINSITTLPVVLCYSISMFNGSLPSWLHSSSCPQKYSSTSLNSTGRASVIGEDHREGMGQLEYQAHAFLL